MSTASAAPDPPRERERELDLDGLIQSLPACKRCRECRRGCDTLLPKCRQCTKAGVDCIFYDHGRNEYLPRSYIAELVDHVRRISARTNPSPTASGGTPHEVVAPVPPKTESVVSDPLLHYDHHFAYAGGTYRYLGSESCLIKSPRLRTARPNVPFDSDSEWRLSWQQTPDLGHELIRVYLDTIHPLYPILDTSARYLSPDLPSNLTDTERFSLNMVYSIACHVMPAAPRKDNDLLPYPTSGKLSYHTGNSIKYRHLAGSFFDIAMQHVEESTVDPTIDTLRSILLLAINSLFDPSAGNVGQQVALATRLALALEFQIEMQEPSPQKAAMIKNMHSTIFSIENEIASTLDRPATFPEPTWDLSFDKDRPADFLCSLYRLQHRFRKADRAGREAVKSLLPSLDERGVLQPSLRMALHQTHLLLNPVWGSAWYVLEAVVSVGAVHIFLTPHWVFRAGTIIIHSMPDVLPANLIQLYANALVVLEVSSWKWGSSAALSSALTDIMQQMKSVYRPDWAGKLTHYDVGRGSSKP